MGTGRFGTKIELEIMEKNDNYFNDKSEAEKLRNVSSLVDGIVNAKPEETLTDLVKEVQESEEDSGIVDLVGKAISTHKPKGMFMHGVQTDDNPKL